MHRNLFWGSCWTQRIVGLHHRTDSMAIHRIYAFPVGAWFGERAIGFALWRSLHLTAESRGAVSSPEALSRNIFLREYSSSSVALTPQAPLDPLWQTDGDHTSEVWPQGTVEGPNSSRVVRYSEIHSSHGLVRKIADDDKFLSRCL